jgi:hypothetical protein
MSLGSPLISDSSLCSSTELPQVAFASHMSDSTSGKSRSNQPSHQSKGSLVSDSMGAASRMDATFRDVYDNPVTTDGRISVI